jgi:hypothetical protein
MVFSPSLRSARAVGTGGVGWGLPTPPSNVLAFIQTAAAPLLFQIHPRSRFCLLVRQKKTTFENKIAILLVLPYEASLIGGSL